MKTVILDGVPTEISDEAAAAVVKMKAALIGAVATVSAKEGEINALKANLASELAAANAHVHDREALDAAVALRVSVIDSARVVQGASVDVTGKSEAEIRRLAVASRLGEVWVADKDDAFIQAAFDTLLALASVDNNAVPPSIVSHVLAKDVVKAYEAPGVSMRNVNRSASGNTE